MSPASRHAQGLIPLLFEYRRTTSTPMEIDEELKPERYDWSMTTRASTATECAARFLSRFTELRGRSPKPTACVG